MFLTLKKYRHFIEFHCSKMLSCFYLWVLPFLEFQFKKSKKKIQFALSFHFNWTPPPHSLTMLQWLLHLLFSFFHCLSLPFLPLWGTAVYHFNFTPPLPPNSICSTPMNGSLIQWQFVNLTDAWRNEHGCWSGTTTSTPNEYGPKSSKYGKFQSCSFYLSPYLTPPISDTVHTFTLSPNHLDVYS